MRRRGTRAGIRVYDGLLHELGHLVVLDISAEELRAAQKRRFFYLEDYVQTKIKKSDTDRDLDECKTIVACVHVLRRMRAMKNTGKFVRGSLKIAKKLCVNPEAMPGQVEELLRDPATKELGDRLWGMVQELYGQEVA